MYQLEDAIRISLLPSARWWIELADLPEASRESIRATALHLLRARKAHCGLKARDEVHEDMKKTLAWGSHVSPEFRARVFLMCENLEWGWADAPDDAMSCMAFETGQKFTANVLNRAGSGAAGLIQFMPDVAEELGTDSVALQQMSPVEQLEYVERYFKPYRHRVINLHGMYLAILYPRYIDAADNSVLFFDGSIAYRQNSGFDANTDGKITKMEVCARVDKMKVLGLQPPHVYQGE